MKKVILFFIASTICVLGNSQILGGLVSKDRMLQPLERCIHLPASLLLIFVFLISYHIDFTLDNPL